MLFRSNIELDLQARYPTMRYSDLLARLHAELEAKLTGKPAPPDVIATTSAVTESSSAQKTQGAAGEGTSEGDEGDKGGVDVERHVRFAQSVGDWPLFPDTRDALARLSKHYKLCVLSNVDRTLFARTQEVLDRKSTRLNSSHSGESRMPSSA